MDIMEQQHIQLFHHEESQNRSQMLWTLDTYCITMATLPNQNNNKGRIQPNKKKFFNYAIQTLLLSTAHVVWFNRSNSHTGCEGTTKKPQACAISCHAVPTPATVLSNQRQANNNHAYISRDNYYELLCMRL